jgi:hypothetical protein
MSRAHRASRRAVGTRSSRLLGGLGSGPAPGGYVLLGVLWAVVAMSALAMTAAVAGRDALAAAGNRAALARAAWQAEGCVARWFAAADAVLAAGAGGVGSPAGDPYAVAHAWRTLDRAVDHTTASGDGADGAAMACSVELAAGGSMLDINRAAGDEIQRLFAGLGVPPAASDSLADALLDWRDADDTARPAGAESAWYATHGRPPPRTGPLAAVAELAAYAGSTTRHWTPAGRASPERSARRSAWSPACGPRARAARGARRAARDDARGGGAVLAIARATTTRAGVRRSGDKGSTSRPWPPACPAARGSAYTRASPTSNRGRRGAGRLDRDGARERRGPADDGRGRVAGRALRHALGRGPAARVDRVRRVRVRDAVSVWKSRPTARAPSSSPAPRWSGRTRCVCPKRPGGRRRLAPS